MIGRGPNSYLLVLVTRVHFCLYVKLFLPSIYYTIDFWNSMSCIVLDFELTDINVIQEWGVFLMTISGILILSFKKVRTHKASILVYKKLACNCVEQWMFGLQWAYQQLSQKCKGWKNWKRNRKCKILGSLMGKEVENLDDCGCLKIRDLFDEKSWIYWSYPLRHKNTLHCAERKAKMLVNWTIQHLNLLIFLYYAIIFQYLRN